MPPWQDRQVLMGEHYRVGRLFPAGNRAGEDLLACGAGDHLRGQGRSGQVGVTDREGLVLITTATPTAPESGSVIVEHDQPAAAQRFRRTPGRQAGFLGVRPRTRPEDGSVMPVDTVRSGWSPSSSSTATRPWT